MKNYTLKLINNIPYINNQRFLCFKGIFYKFIDNYLFYTEKSEIKVKKISTIVPSDFYFRFSGFNIFKQNNDFIVFTVTKCIYARNIKIIDKGIIINNKIYNKHLYETGAAETRNYSIYWGLNINYKYKEYSDHKYVFSKYDLFNNETKKLIKDTRKILEFVDNKKENIYFTNKLKYLYLLYLFKSEQLSSELANSITCLGFNN